MHRTIAIVTFGLLAVGLATQEVLAQGAAHVKFESITTADGLSNNQINSIYQDQQGYIWIGTLSGLNRYNGYEFKTFFHDEQNPSSIRNNTVSWVTEGPGQTLWVKTSEGISVYNPRTGLFDVLGKYLELLQTDDIFVSEVVKDHNENFWCSIENRGIVVLGEGDRTMHVSAFADADIKIASNQVTDMTLDDAGRLWLVHASGTVEVIEPAESKVIRRYGLPESVSSGEKWWRLFVDRDHDLWLYRTDYPFGIYYLNTTTGGSRILGERELATLVRRIIQHDNGEIWAGADHGGISIIDKNTWRVRHIKRDPDVPKSLANNNINTLFKDKNGGIWTGTTKSGVSYHHRGVKHFNHYKVNRKDPVYNDMSSFVEDEDGTLWIGTNGKGLLRFDRQREEFSALAEDPRYTGHIPDVVVSLARTRDGKIWIGSYLEGLFVLENGQFRNVPWLPDPTTSIWEIFEDSEQNLWIGTLTRGVLKYNRRSGEVTAYDQSNVLNANYVTCLEEDQQGRIWIGTGSGLTLHDPAAGTFRTFVNADSVLRPISNNSIISILADSRGNIWVGSLDGLNRFDPDSQGFEVIREADGLSANIVFSIQEDHEGSLWMSTSHGITKMTVENGSYDFQTFDVSDGLQGESFTEDAGLRTRDGHLVFSGQNGFNIFDPKDQVVALQTPELLMTALLIANECVIPGEPFNDRVLLEQDINETEDIYLKYDENSLAVEFVALSYFQGGKIRYQYKLVGYDDQWINASPDMRRASYASLDYGDYTLRVRSTTNPNTWTDEGVVLHIHISPPWWLTNWAYGLYAIGLALLLYFTRDSIVRRERRKARLENERKEVERQHQLDMLKIKFFTNISHEFRTPLSLVLTPIERMIKNPDQVNVQDLQLVQRNASRLMKLVNQLLDFRKMEANQHVLNQSSGDIISFLQNIVDSFSDLSREKQIRLQFISEVKSFYTFFDKDKMEKIMFNLLSNAFKFTLSGGQVTVDFEILEKSENEYRALIFVTDTGIGIAEEKQQLIFNRFFQNEITEDIVNNGTGIGLSITKEFVELHGGQITVESKPSMGSTFIVELPLKEIHSDEDLADELVKELVQSVESPPAPTMRKNKDMPTVLLVEDNVDFRFYLRDNLKNTYNVQVASNGKEAWKLIKSQHPDMVISDVMMPGMDGHQLCEKIKTDPRTANIPVILLTAQSSDQQWIKGLESGAIDYITKPFNFEILISSINSALRYLRRVKDAEHLITPEPSRVEVEQSADEKLISEAIALVEANMSNAEFSVEDLSHELGYSRGTFYEKIRKLTGHTPIDFIRNIRMKRAAELLRKSEMNVAEVAYSVGYNNPKLFSRYFRSVYEQYPSEYRSKVRD